MRILSTEAISKISETKLEKSRQKIMDSFIKNDIPEQSNIKLAVPTHRTRAWCSFEEFKELIKGGASIKDLNVLYSKHLIAFYNYLSKEHLTLSREQFVEDYEKGMSLEQISKSYNVPLHHIGYLREYYGIKRKGAKYQKRLANEVPLSQEAKDVIIGSLLGDGRVGPDGAFREKHSEKQVKYLEWKSDALKPIISKKGYNAYTSVDERSGTRIYGVSIRTIAHSFLYEMRNKFYKLINNEWIKIIPDNIEELLNEKVLAIWFMDDGCTDWGYRRGIKKYANQKPQCKISTQCFTKEEVERLQIVLENKWQLYTYLSFVKPDKQEQLQALS